MNKLILITGVAFVMMNVSTSFAATCKNNQTCGTVGYESECCWEFNNGTITITGTGEMADYGLQTDDSWVSPPWDEYDGNITSVVVSGVTSVGNFAFSSYHEIENVTFSEGLESIGDSAFDRIGIGHLVLPSTLKNIGSNAFEESVIDSIVIPEGVSIGNRAFDLISYDDSVEINCIGSASNCEVLKENLLNNISSNANPNDIPDYTFNTVSPTSDCADYNSKGCTACAQNYKLSDNGMCFGAWEQKHYTPAEAAQWLNDDNNTITITFKK